MKEECTYGPNDAKRVVWARFRRQHLLLSFFVM